MSELLPDPATCPHEEFAAQVDVHRIAYNEGMPVSHYSMDVKVHCAKCMQPFRFLCSRKGLMWNEPAIEVGGQEIRVPLHPANGTEPMPPPVLGFNIEGGPL